MRSSAAPGLKVFARRDVVTSKDRRVSINKQLIQEVSCVCACACVCVRACVRACACGITEAVRRNHATAKSSCAEVEHHIKEWLKFAAERDGGRRQRDRRSRASAPLPAADPPSDYEQNVSE